MTPFSRLGMIAGIVISTFASYCVAQNVSGYGTMANPILFLLREPAVHDDLELTPEQRKRLVKLNHSFDGLLLASRNRPAEERK